MESNPIRTDELTIGKFTGKLHNGGNLDASSEKELSVKLAFHIKAAKIDNVKTLFLDSPAKKEYDPTVDSIGK